MGEFIDGSHYSDNKVYKNSVLIAVSPAHPVVPLAVSRAHLVVCST